MHVEHRGRSGTGRFAEEGGNKLTGAIIGCGMEVHSRLGPGLLESVYEECLCHELHRHGIAFVRQSETPIRYRDVTLGKSLRIDLLVEDSVIVEVKAIDIMHPVHKAQLLTYLRLTGKHLGLLLNFNVTHFRDGICRRIL